MNCTSSGCSSRREKQVFGDREYVSACECVAETLSFVFLENSEARRHATRLPQTTIYSCTQQRSQPPPARRQPPPASRLFALQRYCSPVTRTEGISVQFILPELSYSPSHKHSPLFPLFVATLSDNPSKNRPETTRERAIERTSRAFLEYPIIIQRLARHLYQTILYPRDGIPAGRIALFER